MEGNSVYMQRRLNDKMFAHLDWMVILYSESSPRKLPDRVPATITPSSETVMRSYECTTRCITYPAYGGFKLF